MKKYSYALTERKRFMGFMTGDNDLSILYSSVAEPKGEGLHYHTESDEIYLPIEGRGTLWVDGKIYRLRPGIVIRVEKGEPHQLLSVSKPPLKLCVAKTPDLSDDKVEIETPEALQRLMGRHHIS